MMVTAFAVAVGVFRENKGRSWRRAARIAAGRYLLGNVRNALDLRFGGVTTAEMYATWARNSGAEVLTDEISEGATLHWIGPRHKDRVFLYLHGTYFPLTLRPVYKRCFDLRGTTHGTVCCRWMLYCSSPRLLLLHARVPS